MVGTRPDHRQPPSTTNMQLAVPPCIYYLLQTKKINTKIQYLLKCISTLVYPFIHSSQNKDHFSYTKYYLKTISSKTNRVIPFPGTELGNGITTVVRDITSLQTGEHVTTL
ncbi:hypothetical protein Hanom_Chr16g01511221 [Helianthus anomalus]